MAKLLEKIKEEHSLMTMTVDIKPLAMLITTKIVVYKR